MVRQLKLFSSPRPKRRGRPKSESAGIPHLRRPDVNRDHPHHVTVRMRRGTWNLRSQRCFSRIAQALTTIREGRDDIRIAHYSVQGDHIHLLVEANDRKAMSNGLRALLISIARRLNGLMSTRGSRFRDRFHEHVLASPTAVRNALRYVLTNSNKHHGGPLVDAYSSGPWFADWAPVVAFPKWTPCIGPPTREAESWLLTRGWRRAGRLLV